MKRNHLFLLLLTFTLLTSCAEKVIVCTIDREYFDGVLSVQYIFENEKLKQIDYYDSTGAVTYKHVFTRDGAGNLTSISAYFSTADTLEQITYVFLDSGGEIDSVQNWTDPDYDGVADYFNRTYIYYHASGKTDSMYVRTNAGVISPSRKFTWTNGDITEAFVFSNSYTYVYTYSNIDCPYSKKFRTEIAAMYFPSLNFVSQHMRTGTSVYDVAMNPVSTASFTPTANANGYLESYYYPSTGSTVTYQYNCVEM